MQKQAAPHKPGAFKDTARSQNRKHRRETAIQIQIQQLLQRIGKDCQQRKKERTLRAPLIGKTSLFLGKGTGIETAGRRLTTHQQNKTGLENAAAVLHISRSAALTCSSMSAVLLASLFSMWTVPSLRLTALILLPVISATAYHCVGLVTCRGQSTHVFSSTAALKDQTRGGGGGGGGGGSAR